MKPFLIVSTPDDLHTHYVTWALKQAGHEVQLLNSQHGNCPSSTTLHLGDADGAFDSPIWQDVEAAWCRRLSFALGYGLIGKPSDDEDEKFVRSEENCFTRWLIDLHEPGLLRWVNYPAAATAAENKFLQLKAARSCGLRVPRTLVTADPRRFRSFLKQEGTIVAKPLRPYSWEHSPGKLLAPYAAVIDAERANELSDEDISQCVTIYQQCIAKVSDVRMLILGQDLFAYRVIQEGEQYFDYRVGFHEEEGYLRFESISVPKDLQKEMARLMEALKINFASADFALTADGEFIFLDLNPSGQWMFIEGTWSGSLVGQRFCSYFVNGSVRADAEGVFPSVTEYRKSDAADELKAYCEQEFTSQETASEE